MFAFQLKCRRERVLFLVFLFALVIHTAKSDDAQSDEEVLVSFKSASQRGQQEGYPLRVSDYFVKKSMLATNSSWLPGQGNIPMKFGQQAQRLNALLQVRETNSAQITLWSIQISPALTLTQSIATFWFISQPKNDVRPKQIKVVMLLDGTIATERPHENKNNHLPANEDINGSTQRINAADESVGDRRIGINRGDLTAPDKSEFQIPNVQWAAMNGDDYPADLCAQEGLAATYLKREKPDVQAPKLEGILLEHYLPMQAIIAKGLAIPAHLNHWQATFFFRDEATDSTYHVPVLLDNRILGFTEFSRRSER